METVEVLRMKWIFYLLYTYWSTYLLAYHCSTIPILSYPNMHTPSDYLYLSPPYIILHSTYIPPYYRYIYPYVHTYTALHIVPHCTSLIASKTKSLPAILLIQLPLFIIKFFTDNLMFKASLTLLMNLLLL